MQASEEKKLIELGRKIYLAKDRDYTRSIDDLENKLVRKPDEWTRHLLRLGIADLFYRIESILVKEQDAKEEAERKAAKEAQAAHTQSKKKKGKKKAELIPSPRHNDDDRLRIQGEMLAKKKVHLGGNHCKLFMNCTGEDLGVASRMRRARENGFKRSADFYDTFAGFVGKDETVAEHFSKDGQIDYIELGRMREGSPVTNAEITMKP